MKSTDLTAWQIVPIVIFCSGAFLGYFLTGLAPMTPRTWPYFVGGRVLWQLGGAILLGVTVAGMMDEAAWKGALAAVPLGLLLCYNPVLDVIRGPLTIEGELVEDVTERGKIVRTTGTSPTVHARVGIRTPDGQVHHFTPGGLQANRWQDLSAPCLEKGPVLRVIVLRHLDAFLDVQCGAEQVP